jgi:hypothetical protein
MNSRPDDPGTDAVPGTTTQRWIYGGIRVLDGKRIHAWIDPAGRELLYAHTRSVSRAIGSYYTTQVVRAGSSTSLYRTPTYAADGYAPDEQRQQLWAKDTAARARLADLNQQHKAAQRNAVDEAQRPLIAAAHSLKTSADRDAFTTDMMRQLIGSWAAPNPKRSSRETSVP